jgi:hypothetical protein
MVSQKKRRKFTSYVLRIETGGGEFREPAPAQNYAALDAQGSTGNQQDPRSNACSLRRYTENISVIRYTAPELRVHTGA